MDLLRFEGFSVESVGNGQEAIEWLHGHQSSHWLIILDLMMPVMNGKAFLAARGADPLLAPMPVIVLTAGGDCRDLVPSDRVARCMSKTIAPPELIAAIAACN